MSGKESLGTEGGVGWEGWAGIIFACLLLKWHEHDRLGPRLLYPAVITNAL